MFKMFVSTFDKTTCFLWFCIVQCCFNKRIGNSYALPKTVYFARIFSLDVVGFAIKPNFAILKPTLNWAPKLEKSIFTPLKLLFGAMSYCQLEFLWGNYCPWRSLSQPQGQLVNPVTWMGCQPEHNHPLEGWQGPSLNSTQVCSFSRA